MKFNFKAAVICMLMCVVLFPNTTYAAQKKQASSQEKTISEFENSLDEIEEDFKQSLGYEDGNAEIYFDLKLERGLEYKTYMVKNSNISLSYQNTESFSENISGEYLLNIPISNGDDDIVGVVRFYCYEDGVCTLYSFGRIEEEELIINEELESLENVDEKKAVKIDRYDLLMLYYRVGENEYVRQLNDSVYISLDTGASALAIDDEDNTQFTDIVNLISVVEEYNEENNVNSGTGTNVLYSGVGSLQSEEDNTIQKYSFIMMIISIVVLICTASVFGYNKLRQKRS